MRYSGAIVALDVTFVNMPAFFAARKPARQKQNQVAAMQPSLPHEGSNANFFGMTAVSDSPRQDGAPIRCSGLSDDRAILVCWECAVKQQAAPHTESCIHRYMRYVDIHRSELYLVVKKPCIVNLHLPLWDWIGKTWHMQVYVKWFLVICCLGEGNEAIRSLPPPGSTLIAFGG